jgi:NAD(P)H-dependent flavin oxidoreductase YrpB (nitropropane dioxygenase family)
LIYDTHALRLAQHAFQHSAHPQARDQKFVTYRSHSLTRNTLTLFRLTVPVVQGGMQWVGYAELASAVSNAGGLGIITALTQPTPEDLRKEIQKCKKMTNKPFGVNLTLLPSINPPDYPAYAQAIIDEGIRIVETAGNSPGPIIKQLKAASPPCIILHKCTTIRHALSAVKLGVDFLSIDGFECAGHVGETDITNLILLSKSRQVVPIPFIA